MMMIVVAEEEFTADTYRKFVRSNSQLYLGLAGCIRQLDELAAEFVSADDQSSPLKRAQEVAESFKGKKEEAMAKVYVAYMDRIAERGVAFVEAEKQRLKKLLAGKVSDTKKDDLKRRLNVLESFTSPNSKGIKTEL